MGEIATAAGGVLCVLLTIMTITLLAISFQSIDSGQVGLQYDRVARDLSRDVQTEGLHNGPPGFKFIKFPATFENLRHSIDCLSRDGLEISLSYSFQFVARAENLHSIVKEFKNYERYNEVVSATSKAAAAQTCSEFLTTEFQAKRGEIQSTMIAELQGRLDVLRTDINDLQITNIQRPPQYEAAVQEKEAAAQSIQVAQAERPIRLTEIQELELRARQRALSVVNTAKSFERITLLEANATAEAIKTSLEIEAQTYASIKNQQGLSVEGFLAYLGVRVIEAKSNVLVAMDEPAQASFSTEL
eukprot:m.482836 g.482836  ORF g.482836 m.482836 type:complete len:302 (+) comp22681_c0_seq1:774-1679(+)